MADIKSNLEIYADVIVVQGLIFAVTVYATNKLFVQPLIRLHEERKRRTSGALDSARSDVNRARELEEAYNQRLNKAMEEVREERLQEIMAGQAEAEGILGQARDRAQKEMEEVKTNITSQMSTEKARIPELSKNLADSILKGLTGVSAAIFAFGLLPVESFAAGGVSGSKTFWAYFQFICFVAALVFLGKKAVNATLESKRDALKVKLSEAKEALVKAQEQAKLYETKNASLEQEMKELRDRYVNEGVQIRKRIITEAEQSAERLITEAKRSASELVNKSREELRSELVKQAVAEVEARLQGEVLGKIDGDLKQDARKGVQELKSFSV